MAKDKVKIKVLHITAADSTPINPDKIDKQWSMTTTEVSLSSKDRVNGYGPLRREKSTINEIKTSIYKKCMSQILNL